MLITLVSCDENEIFFSDNVGKQNVLLQTKEQVSNADFFWYKGEKHYLIPDSSTFFVVYNNTNAIPQKDVIKEGIYSNLLQGDVKNRKLNANRQKWQVIKKHNATTTKTLFAKNSSVCYRSPYYVSAKSGNPVGISNLIHVKLKKEEDISILEDQMEKYNLSLYSQNEFMPLWYTVFCNDDSMGNSLHICNILHETELFAFVEPDFMVDLSMSINSFQAPNDPFYDTQWNLHGNYSINWPEASTTSTGENVNVGVIDEGVALLHPDLNSSMILPAYDAYAEGEHWFVNNLYGFHGTNCIGIIAARMNNNLGITGISPDVHVNSYSDPLTARPNASQDLASDLCIALTSNDVVSCSWGSNDIISSE